MTRFEDRKTLARIFGGFTLTGRCKHDLVDTQCATCMGTDRTPAQDEALRRASACNYDRKEV